MLIAKVAITAILCGFAGEIWSEMSKYLLADGIRLRNMDRPGVYVDLAANDYRYISNSYFADHCLKFDGVCIEPNNEYWGNLDKKRRCAVVKTCIAETGLLFRSIS